MRNIPRNPRMLLVREEKLWHWNFNSFPYSLRWRYAISFYTYVGSEISAVNIGINIRQYAAESPPKNRATRITTGPEAKYFSEQLRICSTAVTLEFILVPNGFMMSGKVNDPIKPPNGCIESMISTSRVVQVTWRERKAHLERRWRNFVIHAEGDKKMFSMH